ncbi:MAG: hypothetical protein AAFQ98_18900 [Bacteroidota bacterium]
MSVTPSRVTMSCCDPNARLSARIRRPMPNSQIGIENTNNSQDPKKANADQMVTKIRNKPVPTNLAKFSLVKPCLARDKEMELARPVSMLILEPGGGLVLGSGFEGAAAFPALISSAENMAWQVGQRTSVFCGLSAVSGMG